MEQTGKNNVQIMKAGHIRTFYLLYQRNNPSQSLNSYIVKNNQFSYENFNILFLPV